MEIRRERTHLLRELSERKNREFRTRMIGETLSAVTLEQRGMALTSNFLKVQLAELREPNQIIEVRIGALSNAGLREGELLQVL